MTASAGKRVLMIVENDTYPEDDRVRCEAEALMAAGYPVSVISIGDPGQARYEVLNGAVVRRYRRAREANGFIGYIWEYSYSMFWSFVLSLSAWTHEGFDVIHAHNPPDTLVFIALFYKLFGKKFVFDHHDLSAEMYLERFSGGGNRLIYKALVALENLSCRVADQVIASNESYKKVEMERGGVPETKDLDRVRNGPDFNRVQIVEPDARLLATGKTIIGYVGAIGVQDGLDYLLRSLQHLVYDLGRTDFYCIVIGKGDAVTSLKQLATELKLDEFIWFTGWISMDDVNRYLSTAHICVVPDPKNPFTDRSTMIKIVEYMTYAKPIVAFDLMEHRYSARDAAVYIEPNNELAFAKAIAELMDDPDRRQAMGEAGRARIKAELRWEYSVPHLLSAYESLWPQPSCERVSRLDANGSGEANPMSHGRTGAQPAHQKAPAMRAKQRT